MPFFTKEHQEAMARINGKPTHTNSKRFVVTQFEKSNNFYIDSDNGSIDVEDASALLELNYLITAVLRKECGDDEVKVLTAVEGA